MQIRDFIGMIEELVECGVELTDWEDNFLDSLSISLNDGVYPTQKQIDVLTDLYERNKDAL